MTREFIGILLVSLSLLQLAKSQAYCPPFEAIEPCSCSEFGSGKQITCNYITNAEWDIKATFDSASKYINNSLIFDRLLIFNNEHLQEIPANAVQHLQFKSIEVVSNKNLFYISPSAFSGSYEVTKNFEYVEGSEHGSQGGTLFKLLRKFKVVETITIRAGISELPTDAFWFITPLEHLKSLKLIGNGLRTIGARAFRGLPALEYLTLSFNSLGSPLGGLHSEAFSLATPNLRLVELQGNQLKYLDQKVFQPLLDSTNGQVVLGIPRMEAYMECGPRADWICENSQAYATKLIGYYCDGGVHKTLWEYCS